MIYRGMAPFPDWPLFPIRTGELTVRRHMLAAATVRTLEELAQRSHASYPQGGLLYTFTEAANQAHCRFPQKLADRRAAHLTEDDRAQLGLVICKALGNFSCAKADVDSLAIADDLMQRLRRDLEFTSVGAVVDDDDDYCWGSTIHMARETDNRYFSLCLWGSID
jgi:hypothetical protein